MNTILNKVSRKLKLQQPSEKNSYRGAVGPHRTFDIVSAMTFNLLTCLGLREYHKLLDIGCGSLRNGRLLIPYLNPGNYVGIEPQKWLVTDGVKYETGEDLIRIKKAKFIYSDSPNLLDRSFKFDYAVAQSIFSHTSLEQMHVWINGTSDVLTEAGALLATFICGDEDYKGDTWNPGKAHYRVETMKRADSNAGMNFRILNWRHQGSQTWAIFAKPEFDMNWITDEPITWNRRIGILKENELTKK